MNLALEVLGRRPDGLHEILTVMQTVSLCDVLHVSRSASPQFRCNEKGLEGKDNLVIRTADLLARHLGQPLIASVVLSKRIPVAAGLGGGSSDAAAALAALLRLHGVRLPFQEVSALAFQLGADVPFFLQGGTCLVAGAGESVRPLRPVGPCTIVVVVPPIVLPSKTATIYSLLRPQHFSSGGSVSALADAIDRSGAVPSELLTNTFEAVALGHFDQLRSHWDKAASITRLRPHLSGTGPSFFFLLDTPSTARECAAELRKAGLRTFVLSPTRRGHIVRRAPPST